MFLDGPLPGPFDIEAGARSFSSTTRTMLHRKRRLSSIDKHTGATRTLVKGLSFIQHLEKPDLIPLDKLMKGMSAYIIRS